MMTVPQFQPGGRIGWTRKPIPTPGPGQLLIRVRANALCGSERGQFFQGAPVTPGHEAAGVVEAAGPDTQIPAGTPGVIYLMDFCGECRSCREGATNQCLQKRADMGFNQDGGYGPFELVSERIFFPIDPELPMAEATMLLDIMGTGGHAIARARLIRPTIESVLIMGAGPVGLGVLAMVRLFLGEQVPAAIADISEYRLDLAKRLGGQPVDLREQEPGKMLGNTGITAVDAAFDTSGKEVARETALRFLDRRGVLVCVGHGEGIRLDVSRDLIAPERAVLGSEYFRFDELPENLERIRKHCSYLSPIITHRFGVDELQQAFELFFSGRTGKVVIEQ